MLLSHIYKNIFQQDFRQKLPTESHIMQWKPQHAIYWHRALLRLRAGKSHEQRSNMGEPSQTRKQWYFDTFIRIFCNKISGKNFLQKATSCNESHNTPYTGTGSFSHWDLVKATSSVLAWEGHRKQGRKHWYFHSLIGIFCKKILG